MDKTRNLIVGFFVGGCLLLFAVGLFLIGNSSQLFSKSFNAYAQFSKITGIQKGGKVRVAGMDAGTVTLIEVPPQPGAKFRVHFRIIEKLHPIVRQDSVVTIQTDGLLGNTFLQIDSGSTASPLAQNDSMIQSKEPFDWGNLMEDISNVVHQVNSIMITVKDQISSTLTQIEGTVKLANVLVKDATPEVKSILLSARKISENLNLIIDGVQEGEGAVGALLKDKELQAGVRRSVENTEKAIDNVREATASTKKIVGKVAESDIVPEIQRTVKNLQQITGQVKSAVDKFESAAGEGGVADNLQRTLVGAQEAMSDLADDTEALKHNFFFRGFFKKRGFYDLGALSVPEYTAPSFGKGFKRQRVWLDNAGLFVKNAKGEEILSPEGKTKLDEAMTALLAFPRNGPLIIEGFAGQGTPAQRYLSGRRRAALVQAFLILRFRLRPAYVGIVSMNADRPGPVILNSTQEGVGIVSFYK